jgi:hypothetical protein
MKKLTIIFIITALFTACIHPTKKNKSYIPYTINNLIYEDNFSENSGSWILEYPDSPNSEILFKDNKLVIDVNGGTTVWYNQKLSGNFLIEYKRKVIIENGENDRLSDLNQFWMATDPHNEDLFTRSGKFHEYHALSLYYFGMGGNGNSTTRFRKYPGDGNRNLIFDSSDKEHLLEANKEYKISITVYDGTTKVFIDNSEMISYTDTDPLSEGYFGFRTVKSRQVIKDFKVYSLK